MRIVMLAFLLLGVMTAPSVSADPSKNVDAKRIHVLSLRKHSIEGLPVWTKNGLRFDPSYLVELIETKIDSAALGSGSSISFYEPQEILYIMTSNSNHDEIAKLLASMRTAGSYRQ
jgi:hypothetical protein